MCEHCATSAPDTERSAGIAAPPACDWPPPTAPRSVSAVAGRAAAPAHPTGQRPSQPPMPPLANAKPPALTPPNPPQAATNLAVAKPAAFQPPMPPMPPGADSQPVEAKPAAFQPPMPPMPPGADSQPAVAKPAAFQPPKPASPGPKPGAFQPPTATSAPAAPAPFLPPTSAPPADGEPAAFEPPAPVPASAEPAAFHPPAPPAGESTATEGRDRPAAPSESVALADGAPTGTAQLLAEELADLVPVDEILIDGDFFDDLGADSMVMARFCARVRKRPDLPSLSMKDVYENPTIASLALALGDVAAEEPGNPAEPTASPTRNITIPARTLSYVLCGTLQFLYFAGFAFLGSLIAIRSFFWIAAATGPVDIYLRTVVLLTAVFAATSVLPILAKWLLVGRWTTTPIRLWSLRYFRFWVVKTLIRSSPIVLLNGRSTTSSSSPVYNTYLRALGAKIGHGVTILSRNVPVCTDLLTIGDNTVVRKDSIINCYRANGGVIEPGPVTLGRHVFIGEATVLDIGTAVEDGAQLGHASSLQRGQVIPTNERYQGAPAEPTDVDYRTADVVGGTSRRRAVYGSFQLLNALVLSGPIGITIAIVLIREISLLQAIVNPAASGRSGLALVGTAAIVSSVLFFGSLVVGLLVVGTVPRFLRRFVKPDTTYPIFGVRYLVHRAIAGATNIQFFTILFGDSSFVVHYLRWIGYNLSAVEQTGSNFGTQVKHESPFLTTVGPGTVVADGLSVINADFSSTSFKLAPVAIGANNFLGNNIVYPSQGRTGDDCLLGTKVAVPVTGETREGVGLLGSPNFEIPRSVDRDRALEIAHNEEILRPLLLTAKNRHNLVTMGLYLAVRWVLAFGLLLLLTAVFGGYQEYGAWVVAASAVGSPLAILAFWILVDRSVGWLQALEPDGCSIYHRNFWRHERYWKVPAFRYIQAYNGTPFKTMIWRLLGVKVGAKVFDDGCFITEKAFAEIGDNCTLNVGSTIQCHSQEDGGFKSDRTSIGAGCTLGVGAFVHYGVTIGDESVLSADSFLMKGQEMPPQTVWAGNPAQEVQR